MAEIRSRAIGAELRKIPGIIKRYQIGDPLNTYERDFLCAVYLSLLASDGETGRAVELLYVKARYNIPGAAMKLYLSERTLYRRLENFKKTLAREFGGLRACSCDTIKTR